MEYKFSKHALDQLQERAITVQQVEEVLQNPQQLIKEANYTVLQSIIKFGDKDYLVRVFLNDTTSPNRIITVYKT
jgi:hypothetical protein